MKIFPAPGIGLMGRLKYGYKFALISQNIVPMQEERAGRSQCIRIR